LARGAVPDLPAATHGFLVTGFFGPPPFTAVSLATQAQAAGFLSSEGAIILDPNRLLRPAFGGQNVFETPPDLAPDTGLSPVGHERSRAAPQ
jgi:hypothetical protein